MSKIQLMGSGAYDVYCTTKRVYWRPVTATTVLKIGQPVCYNSDAVVDHKERTADPTHLGLTKDTYAEGEQEFTGRLFIVEEPSTANLMSFAGIVKSLGEKAGKDGDMIEIFVPTEGAIVPVYTDQDCVFDRTIVGILNASVKVTKPGHPMGVAKETKDRSGTDGMVWMEFRKFIHGNTNETLQVDDDNTTAVRLHHINVEFLQTAGQCSALFIEAAVGSGGNADSYDYGLAAYFQATYKSGSTIGSATVVGVWMNIDDGANTVDGGHISAIQAGIYQAGSDDPWEQDQVSVAPLQLNLQIEDDPGNNCLTYIRMRNDGAHAIDGIFSFPSPGNCALNTSGDINSSHTIPFLIGGTLYYLLVSSTGS